MHRNLPRSQLLYPGMVFLALLLFFVPEVQVNWLHSLALSALSPVLKPLAGFSHTSPDPALSMIQLESLPEAEPAKNEPDARYLAQKMVRQQARITQLENELYKLRAHAEPPELPPGIQANIIARRTLWQEPILGLDCGAAEGVRENAGVLFIGVPVGRIIKAGPHASSMALLTHRGVSIAARLVECRVEGLLQGLKDDGGERLCRLTIVGRECSAKIGERVATSGLDGAFPAGLWLGVVAAIKKAGEMRWELAVQPAFNANAIEIVHVLTGNMPEVPWPEAPKERQGSGISGQGSGIRK